MPARPVVGEPYWQEYYAGEAEDRAEVVGFDRKVSVPYGSFTGCLQTIEWTLLEPGVAEYKFYAPGVGLVLEASRGGGSRSALREIGREQEATGGS